MPRPIVFPPADTTRWGGSDLRYLPGDRDSQPHGLESTFEFNSLLFHDRRVLDCYRVLTIDGFGDADLRDSRIDRPGEHGEIPLEALYGGRTIIFSGRIEAGNLMKLRMMAQELRSAFVPLTEQPLYIHDMVDSANDVYISCRKSAPIAIREEQGKQQMWRDFMITLRASNPRFLSVLNVVTNANLITGTNPVFSLRNDGNFQAQPIIRVHGGVDASSSPFIIQNDSNSQAFGLNSVIAPGHHIEINTDLKTVRDDTGANRFSEVVIGSDWLDLGPGHNDMSVVVPFVSGTPTITMWYRHTWI